MKKSITISIPEPCHENWAKMTPTEKGKHCQVCTKEVIDFSGFSDEQIVKRVQNGENLCGRFKASQINRELKLERKKRNSLLPIAASIMLPMSVMTAQQNMGDTSSNLTQEKVISIKSTSEVTEKNITAPSTSESSIIIKGTVKDDQNLPLPGINIIIKGTSTGTITDFDGNYEIEAKAGQRLVFSYIGFKTKEIFISNILQHIDIKLEYLEEELLGEFVVVGMISTGTSKTNPAAKPYANMEKNHGKPDNLTPGEVQAKKNAKRFDVLKLEQKKAERQAKKAKRRNSKN